MTPGKASAGTRGEALSAATDALAAAGVDSPRLDAELLLCAAASLEREDLAAYPEAPLDAGAGRRFGEGVRRRLRREPIAYILGRRSFRYLELVCDRRALVPRPETELLVEIALEEEPGSVLDVGTGSGAVALAVASELPECRVTGTDVSEPALELARENAIRLGLADRVRFEPGMLPAAAAGTGTDAGEAAGGSAAERDTAEAVGKPGPDEAAAEAADGTAATRSARGAGAETTYDLAVANLPYVASAEWESLPPEIREHEPREALDGGPDGLVVIRRVVGELSEAAERPCPVLAFEVGAGQADEVSTILAGAGWPETETRRDLAGIERAVIARR